jgi:topoisomerase IA-like protein
MVVRVGRYGPYVEETVAGRPLDGVEVRRKVTR